MAKGHTQLEEDVGLEPRTLTPNPDFLRIGCLAGRFPFALSSHSVCCPHGQGEHVGTGLMSTAHSVTVLLAWGDSTWVGTRNREMEKMVPGTLLPSLPPLLALLLEAASAQSFPFCWLLILVCDMSQCPWLVSHDPFLVQSSTHI